MSCCRLYLANDCVHRVERRKILRDYLSIVFLTQSHQSPPATDSLQRAPWTAALLSCKKRPLAIPSSKLADAMWKLSRHWMVVNGRLRSRASSFLLGDAHRSLRDVRDEQCSCSACTALSVATAKKQLCRAPHSVNRQTELAMKTFLACSALNRWSKDVVLKLDQVSVDIR